MNRDDILLAMKEIGAAKHDLMPKTYEGVVDVFERFAALVRADEREQCAKVCDEAHRNPSAEPDECAAAIRSRT